MNDKSELLSQLKIDRSQKEAPRSSSKFAYLLGGGALAA